MTKWFFCLLLLDLTVCADAQDAKMMRGLLGVIGSPAPACTGLDAAWTPSYGSLLGYWKMNGTVGNAIASGDVATATVGSNGTYKNSDGAGATFISGVVDSAALFDGVDDYMVVSYASAQETSYVTIAGWIKLSTAPTAGSVIASKAQSSGYYFSVSTSGKLFWEARIAGAYRTVTSAVTVPVGDWHHVAATYDGSNLVIYLDGTAVGTTPYTGTIEYTVHNALCFGKDVSSGNTSCGGAATSVFPGAFDDMAVWTTALSADDIMTLKRRKGCTH